MRSQKFRDSDYLEHIANRIARIERATSGVDSTGFRGNEDLQAAIERYIEVIGDAAGKLSQHTRDLAPDVPWSQVIGARNVIVHGHFPSLRVALGRLRQLLIEKEPDRREDLGQ